MAYAFVTMAARVCCVRADRLVGLVSYVHSAQWSVTPFLALGLSAAGLCSCLEAVCASFR